MSLPSAAPIVDSCVMQRTRRLACVVSFAFGTSLFCACAGGVLRRTRRTDMSLSKKQGDANDICALAATCTTPAKVRRRHNQARSKSGCDERGGRYCTVRRRDQMSLVENSLVGGQSQKLLTYWRRVRYDTTAQQTRVTIIHSNPPDNSKPQPCCTPTLSRTHHRFVPFDFALSPTLSKAPHLTLPTDTTKARTRPNLRSLTLRRRSNNYRKRPPRVTPSTSTCQHGHRRRCQLARCRPCHFPGHCCARE